MCGSLSLSLFSYFIHSSLKILSKHIVWHRWMNIPSNISMSASRIVSWQEFILYLTCCARRLYRFIRHIVGNGKNSIVRSERQSLQLESTTRTEKNVPQNSLFLVSCCCCFFYLMFHYVLWCWWFEYATQSGGVEFIVRVHVPHFLFVWFFYFRFHFFPHRLF